MKVSEEKKAAETVKFASGDSEGVEISQRERNDFGAGFSDRRNRKTI